MKKGKKKNLIKSLKLNKVNKKRFKSSNKETKNVMKEFL